MCLSLRLLEDPFPSSLSSEHPSVSCQYYQLERLSDHHPSTVLLAHQISSIDMLSLFGFGPLIYVSVLLLNAVAILSEDRFLARIGWGRAHLQQSSEPSFGGVGANDPDSIKSRVVNLISSIRMVTRVPLIAVNMILIAYELVLG